MFPTLREFKKEKPNLIQLYINAPNESEAC